MLDHLPLRHFPFQFIPFQQQFRNPTLIRRLK